MHILTPHRQGAGYFLDNQGLGTNERKEGDVQQCSHCERVIIMQKWKDDGGFCGRCMAPICGPCADRMLTYGCEPALKAIEKIFNLVERLAQYRRMAGLDAPPPNAETKIQIVVPQALKGE